MRLAVAPYAPDFDCTVPTVGLIPERLVAAAATASVAAPADRPWTLPALRRLLARPLTAGCEAAGMAAAAQAAPAEVVRAAAAWLGQGASFRDDYPAVPLREVRRLYCEGTMCEEEGALPDDLAAVLAPVLFRARRAVEAELDRRAQMGPRTASEWAEAGGDGLLASTGGGFDPSYAPDRAYLTASRIEHYEAAAALIEVATAVDWSPFTGRIGVSWRLQTPWGPVVVADAQDHEHRFEVAPLLLIDLGGDDRYLGRSGSSAEARPVAIVIDLGGRDHHGYPELTDTSTESALAADGAGRLTDERFVEATVSSASRQGGARTGVALWLDLGADDDVYVALRASQGYAHHGVGVLVDAGGDDLYRVEAAGQGAAQFGIGLLMDLGGGDDRYLGEHVAQGHGYTAGVGVLFDDGGADRYHCAPRGARYPAPQREGAMVSLCQGAGFGRRAEDPAVQMPGGLGLLLDRAGDDRYEAGVYGQGVGLAGGVGVLVDGAGRDSYDLIWHGQGAGVHGGAGVLRDRGVAADRYGSAGWGTNVLLGAGHDAAVGVFIDEGGDDDYQLSSLSAGAATCGSVGLFADERGDDRYASAFARALGWTEVEGCARPPTAVMADAGGTDRYPVGAPARDDGAWSDGRGGLGVDGRSASGLSGVAAPR